MALAAPGVLSACSSAEPSGSGAAAPAGAPPADGVPLSQVPVGGGVILDVDPDPVLVVRPTPGTVTAFNATCPHAGSTVDPPQGGTITCPNHFSQFDAATGALRKGPASRGLTAVPVRVVDGVVRLA